jgi:hypothetical protein
VSTAGAPSRPPNPVPERIRPRRRPSALPCQNEPARTAATTHDARGKGAAGLGERVSFAQRDVAAEGLPQLFDMITTFDVAHDAVDPLSLLRAIRQGLEPDGAYLLLEINCAERAEDNAGPIAQVLYGFSLLYCTKTRSRRTAPGSGRAVCPRARSANSRRRQASAPSPESRRTRSTCSTP